MQPPEGNQLWCPAQSLWSLIAEHVPGSELPKIHTALGHSLVDMYTDVHTEAEMWHKIWQKSQQRNSSSRTGTQYPRQQGPLLADPPAIKELVRAEVKMLLQTLKERASREGKDGEEVLFRYKPETVDFALSHLDSCHRNRTNHGDTDNGGRPSSHCSVQTIAEDEIEEMRDKLNVTDIDQVVGRLRSVLMEECEALKRLVEHFKGNITQKVRSQCNKSEPTLAELKELRGALQMDLELYPSSLAASLTPPSPLPMKESKNRFRLSAGRRVSDETLQTLSTTSALKPQPPPPLCRPEPRPPLSAPPTKTSASVKFISPMTHGQYRSTSASIRAKKTQTLICNRSTTPGDANSHHTTSLPGPCRDQMMVETVHHCSLSPGQDPHCRTLTSRPSFQIQTPRNSPMHGTHLPSHPSIHTPSRKCDPSPQGERKSSPAWRSRNINTIPSSPHCDASSKSTDYSVSTTEKSKTQNGRQNSTCGGRLVSTKVQTDNDRRKSSSESLHSRVRSRTSNTLQQNVLATCTHPESIQINGQFFTSAKRPLEGATSQLKTVQETQTELEFISKFYQPVPPARVPT